MSDINKPLIGVAAVVLIVAAGGWYLWHRQHAPLPPALMTASSAPAPAAPAHEETIQHPVPAASNVTNAPLPALIDSDTPLLSALVDSLGGASVAAYLVPESIIRHIVVTIDNLPRQKLPLDKRPAVATPGPFRADGDELHATIDSQNFQRYEPVVGIVEKADMSRVAAVYLRFYPLFQQAYQDLGYPTGYFNDRLIQVIDMLLATPTIDGPIKLVRPNVMYVFADPTLESRPAGQKLLIRLGPDNAAVIKARLTELRALLAAIPPKH